MWRINRGEAIGPGGDNSKRKDSERGMVERERKNYSRSSPAWVNCIM